MQIRLPNLSIGLRIGLALALPIIGMVLFSVHTIAGHYQTVRDMRDLRKMAELAPVVSALVHELQLERGLSAGFAGAGGTVFGERLPDQQAVADTARQRFEETLNESASDLDIDNTRRTILFPRIDSARDKLAQLGLTRRAIATHHLPVGEITTYYTNLIADLIGITEEMLLASNNAGLARHISAYTRLLRLKELAGQERALGSNGFAVGWFDPVTHTRLQNLIERQEVQLREFRFFASAAQIELFDSTLYGENEAEVQRLRRLALRSKGKAVSMGVDAQHWFDTVTLRIELLRTAEARVGQDLIAEATAIERTATATGQRISLTVLALLVLTVLIASGIARGIIHPLQRMTRTMNNLAGGSVTTEQVEDRQRGDEIGDLARAAEVFRDNQARMAQAEEQVRIATALRVRHQAMSAISQGVLITDMTRRPIYANQAFDEMFGFTASDHAEQTPQALGEHDGPALCLAGLVPAFAAERGFHGVLQLERSDGSRFWCDIAVTPVLDALDRPTHLVGILRDITDSRKVEQELRIAATAFESLHGMMVTDAQGIILRVNKAFVDMTGYPAEEAVGKTPSILKSGRHDAEFYADMWRQLAVTGGWSGEIWDRRKNGEIFPKWQTVSAVRGVDGEISHFVAAFSDISERKAAEQRIHDLAFYDPLTRLPNRRLLLDRLHQALSASARNGSHGALLFIDLDNFKSLNDTRGHDMGDLLLIEVANRLTGCLRGCDTAARLGGDEFVVMLEDLSVDVAPAAQDAETVGEKILDTLNRDYILGGKSHHSTPSIGVTLFHGQDTTIDELLKQADLAMYQAKAAGRNAMRFFDPTMQAVVTARSALEVDLRMALHDNQFVLHYQPQVDECGGITGAEALVRWQHPQRGLVSPAEFIPVAEDTGLILPLGLWVLRTACKRLAEWGRQAATADLTMAVNVSAKQFRHVDFVDQVLAEIDYSGADPTRLKLELTESVLVQDVEETIAKMAALKARGISFSLDDFGTGYSSLAYLKKLPLDQLKIDRSFVRDVLTDPNDAVIAKAILALGQSLGLKVIAEGVETEEQRRFLADNQCSAFQGYLFGKPQE